MPSTFIFGCLKIKLGLCEIPFPKGMFYSYVVLDKLQQRYQVVFPSQNPENYTLKIADGHSA